MNFLTCSYRGIRPVYYAPHNHAGHSHKIGVCVQAVDQNRHVQVIPFRDGTIDSSQKVLAIDGASELRIPSKVTRRGVGLTSAALAAGLGIVAPAYADEPKVTQRVYMDIGALLLGCVIFPVIANLL